MLELEQAQARILALVPRLPSENVPLRSASGRIAAEGIAAPVNLPHFDNSAMDGYAVRAEDVAGATVDRPIRLRLIGKAAAGELFDGQVSAGQCVRVFTGSRLPSGADAVVMQEDTRSESTGDVWVTDIVKPWEHIRFAGEDLKHGTSILMPGDRITPGVIAILAACGVPSLNLIRRPKVGLIATGAELREAGASLGPGQIFESNRFTLAALAEQAGALPELYPVVPDDLTRTKNALEEACRCCDAVITSGGVSVGEFDLVKSAFEDIGGQLAFWKVAIKPGKPFVLGQRDGKLLFGLPGNPVSAFVTFLLLVRPALLQFQGANLVHLPVRQGVLEEPIKNDGDRRHFVRVNLDSQGRVRSAGRQASHLLNSLAGANALLDLPANSAAQAGQPVRVQVWDEART